MRTVSKVTVMLAVGVIAAGVGTGPVLADPPAGITPTLSDWVGVGSNTTGTVMNAIAVRYDATGPAGKLYSWDAVNPVTGVTTDKIITAGKNNTDKTCQIVRPNGSSAAFQAFAKTDGGVPCVDYARAGRGPQTGDPAGLLWVGFAKSAVSWTTPNAGVGKPKTLTKAQLAAIYTCADTTWDEVGGVSTATIVPVLPQPGSDTRAFFLSAIGVTKPGPCVVDGTVTIPGNPNPVPIVEDTGVSETDTSGNYVTGNAFEFANANTIFPYDVADWIAQTPAPAGGGHGAQLTWAPGVLLQPQNISGVSPVVTHSNSIDTINPVFSSSLTRIMWNVVRNAGTKVAPKIPAGGLTIIFGKGGAVCSDTTDLISYGLLPIGNSCGTVFLTS